MLFRSRRTHERRYPERWGSCLAECACTPGEWDLCPPSSLTRSRGALPRVAALIRSRSITPLSHIVTNTGQHGGTVSLGFAAAERDMCATAHQVICELEGDAEGLALQYFNLD